MSLLGSNITLEQYCEGFKGKSSPQDRSRRRRFASRNGKLTLQKHSAEPHEVYFRLMDGTTEIKRALMTGRTAKEKNNSLCDMGMGNYHWHFASRE